MRTTFLLVLVAIPSVIAQAAEPSQQTIILQETSLLNSNYLASAIEKKLANSRMCVIKTTKFNGAVYSRAYIGTPPLPSSSEVVYLDIHADSVPFSDTCHLTDTVPGMDTARVLVKILRHLQDQGWAVEYKGSSSDPEGICREIGFAWKPAIASNYAASALWASPVPLIILLWVAAGRWRKRQFLAWAQAVRNTPASGSHLAPLPEHGVWFAKNVDVGGGHG